MGRSFKVAIMLLPLLASACTEYMVVAQQPRFAGQPHSRPMTSIAGGTAVKPNPGVVAKECGPDEQLAMVRVTRDFGQAFVSILTLGLYAPATIRYWCATSPPPPVEHINTPGS